MINSKIDKEVVLQAIEILRKLNDKHYEDSSKKPLLNDTENVLLQVTLKKIPKMKAIKMIKVKLPHSLVTDTTDICLITGDLDKKNCRAEIEPDILYYKELLDKHGISQITEIMTLRQLRTEYKPYEAKQKLLAAFDIFLADNKIIECLPNVLGKHFFKKRKFPIRINMKSSNLKNQIENVLTTQVFHLTGHGGTCASEVAYLDMETKDIIDNVLCMTETILNRLPGGLDNIMGMYLKTSKSEAIPIYMSYDSPNTVHLQEEEEEEEFQIDELSTISNAKVKVFKNGTVQMVKNNEAVSYENEQNESDSSSQISNKNTHIMKAKVKTLKIREEATQPDNYKPANLEKIEKKNKKVKTNTSEEESADVCDESEHHKLDSYLNENSSKRGKNESSLISTQCNSQESIKVVKVKDEVGEVKKNINSKQTTKQIDMDKSEHFELDACSDENLNVKNKELKLSKASSDFISIQCNSQDPTKMVTIKERETKKVKKTPKKETQQIDMDKSDHFELDVCSDENLNAKDKERLKLPKIRSDFTSIQCNNQDPTEMVTINGRETKNVKKTPKKETQQIDMDKSDHFELDVCSDENLNIKNKEKLKLPKTRSDLISIQGNSQDPTKMVTIKGRETKKMKKTPKKETQQIAYPQSPEKFKMEVGKVQAKRKRVASDSKFHEQERNCSTQVSDHMKKKIKLEDPNVKGSFHNKSMLKNKRKRGHVRTK